MDRPRLLWVVLLGALVLLVFWPKTAWAASPGLATPVAGAQLFENHCAGCHINGGNILRRSKTLKLAALERNGIANAQAVALIAKNGKGQMGGYGAVLGEAGAEAVGAYVWSQAQAGWPKP